MAREAISKNAEVDPLKVLKAINRGHLPEEWIDPKRQGDAQAKITYADKLVSIRGWGDEFDFVTDGNHPAIIHSRKYDVELDWVLFNTEDHTKEFFAKLWKKHKHPNLPELYKIGEELWIERKYKKLMNKYGDWNYHIPNAIKADVHELERLSALMIDTPLNVKSQNLLLQSALSEEVKDAMLLIGRLGKKYDYNFWDMAARNFMYTGNTIKLCDVVYVR